jgi:uncharacterized membrane protein YkoI
MDNVTFVEIEQRDGSIVEFAIIDRGNGEFSSMTKEHYDKLQAEQSTPIVIDEAKTK